jgi:hypothetical protein
MYPWRSMVRAQSMAGEREVEEHGADLHGAEAQRAARQRPARARERQRARQHLPRLHFHQVRQLDLIDRFIVGKHYILLFFI